MLSGEWTKSACSVMAQSRFGRSVRCSARRSSSSRLRAYPRRSRCVTMVMGSTFAYDANTSWVSSVEASSSTSS